MRTRRAHFRITDETGRQWRMTWCPQRNLLRARRKYDATTFEVTASQLLILIKLRGTVEGKPLRPDVRQIAFA